jgi:nucleoside-diphosphate-sugar epimerase
MSRVLVTGAAGFLGRAFVKHHIAAGDSVLGIDDMSAEHAKRPEGLPTYDDFHALDAAYWMEHSAEATYPFDIAYHFAAPVGGRTVIEGDPLFNADSLRLDSALFRWAAKYSPGVVVYPSSSAVYGYIKQGMDGQPLPERLFHPRNGEWDAPDEMYGFTKMAGEVLAWKYAGYGHNVLCIRPFSGYGEEQSTDYPVPAICKRVVVDRENPVTIWGSGDQKRDFVHVSDVVGATVSRTSAGVAGYQSMNIGSGVGTGFQQVARLAGMTVGVVATMTYDTTKPEGVLVRVADVTEMQKYYTPRVSLEQGISSVALALSR